MNCPKCGQELSPDSIFCPTCGEKVQQAENVQQIPPQNSGYYYQPQPYVQPTTPQKAEGSSKYGMAIASMILGICSFFLCWLGIAPAIVGLILGIIGIKSPKGKGMAIAGITLSAITLAFWITVFMIAIIAGANYNYPISPYFYYNA